MAKNALSEDQIARRMAEAEGQVERWVEAEQEALADLSDASLADPPNDIASGKAGRRLADVREKLVFARQQLALLGAAMDDALDRRQRAGRAAMRDRLQQELTSRAEIGAAMDKCLAELAGLLTHFAASNAAVRETLGGHKGFDAAPLMAVQSVQTVAELRLFGLSNGMWRPKYPALETPHTAKALPTVKQRAAKEAAYLLQVNFPPESLPEPPRAA